MLYDVSSDFRDSTDKVASLTTKVNSLQRRVTRTSFGETTASRFSDRLSGGANLADNPLEDVPDVQEIMGRHVTADVVFKDSCSSSSQESTKKLNFKNTFSRAIRDLGPKQVLTTVESLIPVSFWTFVGEMLRYAISAFVSQILDSRIDTTQSWSTLWNQYVPGSLVFIIVLATANTVELDGNLGRIR